MSELITLSPETLEAIKQHTLAEFPKEMCGALVNGEFIPYENKSKTPELDFVMDRKVLLLPGLQAIVHSHTRQKNQRVFFDLRTPSLKDLTKQKSTNVPWLIFGCSGDFHPTPFQIPRTPSREYIDREFVWFINDCYTLVQDFYRYELGIILADMPYPEVQAIQLHEIARWDKIYDKYYARWNFEKSTNLVYLNKGDLLLTDGPIGECNHLLIYEGESETVLHQSEFSVREPYSNFIGRIHYRLRHRDAN